MSNNLEHTQGETSDIEEKLPETGAQLSPNEGTSPAAETSAVSSSDTMTLEELEQSAKEASIVELGGARIQVGDLIEDFRDTAEHQSQVNEHLIHIDAPEEPKKHTERPRPAEAPAIPEDSAVNVKAEEYLIDTPVYQNGEGEKKKRIKRRAHFFYYIGEAFGGIRAHGFMAFASVGIITACLLIMGAFSLLAVNLNASLQELMDRNEFLAYVDENYSREEAEALQSTIEAVPNVSEVEFITREQAKALYISDQDDSSLYSDLPDTIFRDRYAIHVEDLSQFEETVEAVQHVEGIAKTSAELDVAQGFVSVRNIVVIVAAVLVVILFLVSLFIMSNTIKLATINRGDEIAVMRMCGATNGFIRGPFIYEGMILGILGAGIAFGLLTALYNGMGEALTTFTQFKLVSLLPYGQLYPYVIAAFLAVGLLIGIGGSVVTIRRFLKV